MLETVQLFFLGDVQVQLYAERTIIDQKPLQFVDLPITALPFRAGGETFHTLDQHAAVPRTVKYGNLAITRKLIPEPPQMVVPIFFLGRFYNRIYPIGTRVELFDQPFDCSPFASGVRTLDYHYHTM